MRAARVFATLLSCASLAACAGVRERPAVRAWYESFVSQVGAAWVSRITAAAAQNDPGGCRFSRVDRRTVLRVRVDRSGDLLSVAIDSSSGVPYIDQVALGSMMSIGSFGPPPPSTLDQRGEAGFPFALTLLKPKVPCRAPAGPDGQGAATSF